MAAPTISAITTVPNRGNATNQASFSNDVDTFFSEVGDFQAEANAQASYLDDLAIDVETVTAASASASAASAAASAVSALAAEDASAAAIGAANYKGPWEGKTSAGSIGDSYSYDGAYIYALNVNLANISTSEPSSTNTDWQLVNTLDFTPSVKPTMVLDFANETFEIYDGFGTGFAEKPLNNIVTHTRASSATGVDPIGRVGTVGTDVPRLVFEDGVAKGYLSEEARTNLVLWSEDFSNAVWVNSASSDTPNSSLSPTGTLNATKLVEDSSNTNHYIQQTVSTVSGLTYSASIYVKSAERNIIQIRFATINKSAYFNLNTEQVTGLTSGTMGTIDPIGGGWYRCILTFLTTYTGSSEVFRIHISQSESSTSYQGDGVSGVYLWGAQLEVGSFPTSYIKTQASTVTRSSESMVRTLGNEWNPNEGTFVFSGLLARFGARIEFLSIGSSASEVFFIYKTTNTNNFGVGVITGGVTLISSNSQIPYTANNISVSYSSSEIKLAYDGISVPSLVISDFPLSSIFKLGESYGGSKYSSFSLESLTYYPKALPANELQELSRL